MILTGKLTPVLLLTLALQACGQPMPTSAPAVPAAPPTIDPARLAPFKPLTKEDTSMVDLTREGKVDLGHHLFFEPGLSSSGQESCNSCHVLASFGVDGLAVARGQTGEPLGRSTPTVFNAGVAPTLGWDGLSPSLEDFLRKHLADPGVMGTSEVQIAALGQAGWARYFAGSAPSSPSPVSLDNAVLGLAAYVRRLVTPSPWDHFLAGQEDALTLDEKKGFNKFFENGCAMCHGGVAVGGALPMKLGMIKPWPAPANGVVDHGRAATTKNPADDMMFRSAPLRNVVKTAPYSVDGSVPALETMAKLMARHQLAKEMSDADAASIGVFLVALTGTAPRALIAKPLDMK